MSDRDVIARFKMGEEKKGTHGGARRGAGRKKTGLCRDQPHRARPALSPRHPVHVTLRATKGVPHLRTGEMYRAVRRALVRCLGRDDFRVVHLSIQKNHLHFLIEAASKRALSRGMHDLEIYAAREINAVHHRCGKVFEFRYGAKQIKTSQYARHALAYVLNNWRRHREDFINGRQLEARIDAYSSGVSFDGWKDVKRFAIPQGYEPLPVSPPLTDLLQHEWRRHGKINYYEVPGPLDIAFRW